MNTFDLKKMLLPAADILQLSIYNNVAFKTITQDSFISLLGIAFGQSNNNKNSYCNIFVKNLFLGSFSWNFNIYKNICLPNLYSLSDKELLADMQILVEEFKNMSGRIRTLGDIPRCMADQTLDYYEWVLWANDEKAAWRRFNTACIYLVMREYDYAIKDLKSVIRLLSNFKSDVKNRCDILLNLLQEKKYVEIRELLLRWQDMSINALGIQQFLKSNLI